MKTRWVAGLVGLGAFALAAGATAANQVKEAADNCMNAHAVLMVSRPGNDALIWQLIGNVVKWNQWDYRVVPDYEPMIAQKVSFRQYDVRFTPGGATAYVAHCGHGGTCNKLAQAILKNYPDSGSPWVFCGEVPYLLENPSSAPTF